MSDTNRCANHECHRETGPHNPLDVEVISPENRPVRICRECSDAVADELATNPLETAR